MRLQKYMAHCGVASRRDCEELIRLGRVAVNGQVAQLGVNVEDADQVLLDGRAIAPEKKVYILFNKPANVMCTSSDPQNRQTVNDYFQAIDQRLYTVGRLDYDTEGLVMLTNDGDWAQKLAHPSKNVDKTYYAVCVGKVTDIEAEQLMRGVELEDGLTAPAKVIIHGIEEDRTRLSITIHEGRNRQVKRMLLAVNHQVTFLRRTAVGSLTLEGIKPGQWRYLTAREVESAL